MLLGFSLACSFVSVIVCCGLLIVGIVVMRVLLTWFLCNTVLLGGFWIVCFVWVFSWLGWFCSWFLG